MKPDWDELGEKYENSKKVIIGDVDCTADSGKKLCEKYGVEGYPTIKYFNPPDTEGEKYEGGRSLKELKKFAKTLGPGCSVDTMQNCKKAQLEELQPYIDKGTEALEAELATLKAEVASVQEKHDTFMKELQESYKASEETVKKVKEKNDPIIKLIKAAIPKPKAD